jgi:hypothetical protein
LELAVICQAISSAVRRLIIFKRYFYFAKPIIYIAALKISQIIHLHGDRIEVVNKKFVQVIELMFKSQLPYFTNKFSICLDTFDFNWQRVENSRYHHCWILRGDIQTTGAYKQVILA